MTARLTTVDKPTSLEDTASVIIEFGNGALGTAETGWCDPARTSFLRVHGTKGKLINPGTGDSQIDHFSPSSAVRENAPPILEQVSVPDVPGQHEEWLTCIRDNKQPGISNVWCARHVTEILLGAMESNKTGKTVHLKTSPFSKV